MQLEAKIYKTSLYPVESSSNDFAIVCANTLMPLQAFLFVNENESLDFEKKLETELK